MQRNRKDHKQMAKGLKRLSDTQLYNTIGNICQNYSNTVIEEALVVLNEKYGFGKKRQQDFVDTLNERMSKKEGE